MRRSIAKRALGLANPLLQKGIGVLLPRSCFQAVVECQRGFGPYCTLSFDCDFPRDIAVLSDLIALLERFKIVASFACIGRWIRQFPDIHRHLVACGHELVNHTDTHPNLYHPGYDYAREDGLSRQRFNAISPAQRQREIEQCHETCVEQLDCIPTVFRTPHFGVLHVDDVYAMLRDLGYRYSSSVVAAASSSGGIPYKTSEGIWEFPVSPCPDHPFGVFDTWHSLGKERAAHCGEGKLSHLFAILCKQVSEQGGYANVYFDPKEALESGELERILEVLVAESLPVVTYQELGEKLEDEAAVISLAV